MPIKTNIVKFTDKNIEPTIQTPVQEVKRCSRCKTIQPIENFNRDASKRTGYQSPCKLCAKAIRSLYYERTKKEHADRARFYNYGITAEEYTKLHTNQKGVCAICGNEPNPNNKRAPNLVVDHEHSTDRIRGLLCVTCNIGLGGFYDNINSLKQAIDYLQKFHVAPIPCR